MPLFQITTSWYLSFDFAPDANGNRQAIILLDFKDPADPDDGWILDASLMPNFFQDQLLPWAMYAVSLFNLVLLLWLGLTILLNAQERNWGTYLAGSGFLVGAIFFLLHTAALNYSLDTLLENSPIWWLILSAPVGALPFGWMVLMLWYCGYWDETQSPLRRRTRWLLSLATAFTVCQLVVVWVGWPKFGASPFTYAEKNNITQFVSLRLLLWLYPLFLLTCTGTALLALLRPMPPASWSRQASQKRARPFLLGSSIVQFGVSCAVAGALVYFAMAGNTADLYNPAGSRTALYDVAGHLAQWLDATDFALCAGISLAVMLLGKAVVSFEIFTGKVLPRRGFWRQWRAVVILAAIYSALIATSLGFDVEGIYPLLLSTCLLGVILAIFSHRAYTDRARATANLAPFVASGHLLGGLLEGDETRLRAAIDEPFRALCEDVLNAGRAMLVARGDIAPLFGAPRFYPAAMPAVSGWAELAARHNERQRSAIAARRLRHGLSGAAGRGRKHRRAVARPTPRRRIIYARRDRNRARGGRTPTGFGRRSDFGRASGRAATPESRARRHFGSRRAPQLARRYFAVIARGAALSRRSRRKNHRRA